jgi:hypothetical protein
VHSDYPADVVQPGIIAGCCTPLIFLFIRNSLFSANDFKSIIESLGTNKKRKTSCSNIKPLGDAKAQLIVNIEPEKSNINDYELLFNKNTINEPIYTTN